MLFFHFPWYPPVPKHSILSKYLQRPFDWTDCPPPIALSNHSMCYCHWYLIHEYYCPKDFETFSETEWWNKILIPRWSTFQLYFRTENSNQIFFTIPNPNPVPPKTRVVESLAWTNASKISSCLSFGIPTPVSFTQNVIATDFSFSDSTFAERVTFLLP